jgi:ribose transport system permease protein
MPRLNPRLAEVSEEALASGGAGSQARPAVGSIAVLAVNRLRRYGLLFALLILLVTLSLTARNFLTVSNIMNILLQSSNIGIMAAGLTVVVIAAEIDLSIASLQTLCAVIVAMLLVNKGMPIVPAILITLFAGVGAGAFSGFFVGWFGIPAFILTLAMDSLARGAALIVTQQNSIYGLPESFSVLGQSYVGPAPVAALTMGMTFLLIHLLLTRTVLGANIYAVGGNKEAARVAGINVFAV